MQNKLNYSKMIQLGIIASLYLIVLSCQSAGATQEKALQEIKTASKDISNAEIIRNPVTANNPVDTINVAKMSFEQAKFKYGEVEEGTIVTHDFSFTNTGKAPLIISNAKSTCGCTVPEWPKEPIAVGETGVINVRFDTKGKKKYNTKPIFITANTHPAETTILLIGSVRERE